MSDFCRSGCYWPDCEHRAGAGAAAEPPAGTRWVRRAGLQVPEREAATDSFSQGVDEYFGELLLITGRPWSPR